jgi:hypothetical protein
MAIITNLDIGHNGRLGNQLFQAASAIGIAEKLAGAVTFREVWKTPMEIFEKGGDWTIFKASFEQMIRSNSPELTDNLFFLDECKGQGYLENIYPDYVPLSVINSEKVIGLRGYFQSFKYFDFCDHHVRDQFAPKEEILDYLDQKYSFIKDEEYTSLHVRRGDYITTAQRDARDPHPIQPLSYYQSSIDHLDAKKLLVFSDDISWCKENFTDWDCIFVEEREHLDAESDGQHPLFERLSNQNLFSDYTEMILMSQCANHIIANSSFSWWGAWLNERAEKKVTAPTNWFGAEYAQSAPNINYFSYLNDLIPADWKLI